MFFNFHLYVGDTCALATADNLDNLKAIVDKELVNIFNLFEAYQPSINLSKR